MRERKQEEGQEVLTSVSPLALPPSRLRPEVLGLLTTAWVTMIFLRSILVSRTDAEGSGDRLREATV